MVSATLNRPEFTNSARISMWDFKVIIPFTKSSEDSSSFPYQIISKEPACRENGLELSTPCSLTLNVSHFLFSPVNLHALVSYI